MKGGNNQNQLGGLARKSKKSMKKKSLNDALKIYFLLLTRFV
jgi:hypothetical protein